MDGLLLLAVEALVIGISVWVIVTEVKTAEEIGRILDAPPKPRKARFADLQQNQPEEARRPSRPGPRR